MTHATTIRWAVLTTLAIGLALGGVVATDAGVLASDDSRGERPEHDELGNCIVAEPADGPNGAYAYLEGDGDLVIDLTVDNDALEGDGVSAAARTGIGDVFTLANMGDDPARVWLEHDADDVTFEPTTTRSKAHPTLLFSSRTSRSPLASSSTLTISRPARP